MPATSELHTSGYFWYLLVAMMVAVASRQAFAGPGSCTAFDFNKVESAGRLGWPGVVWVVREGAPVYSDASSGHELSHLSFNTPLDVIAHSETRLQVRGTGQNAPLGWVQRRDLQCAIRPLRGVSGIEKKFYIKTQPGARDRGPVTVTAFHDPAAERCGGKCQELTRFSMFFIFDEEGGSVLLGHDFSLDDTMKRSLVGWVKTEQGYLWDTAYGLRPREDLRHGKEEGSVCAFRTVEDARLREHCIPILGGPRWFRNENRIPLLGREGTDLYRVALPLPGLGATGVEGEQIRISPDALGVKGLDTVEQLKQVDVFFLIDGTESMGPFIDAVRGKDGQPGVVQTLVRVLQEDSAFRAASFRFGFRIYRDTYAGDRNLGEGLSLPPNMCEPNPGSIQSNLRAFQEQLSRVVESHDDSDDYEENLFGGLKKALADDLPNCPNRLKILFVIGDHGYSAVNQEKRGQVAVTSDQIIQLLRGDVETKRRSIVTHFIQTPNNSQHAKDPDAYNRAYDLFHQQAEAVLSGALPSGRKADEYILRLSDAELASKVLATVRTYSHPEIADEIIMDLRGGAALAEIIQRLQKTHADLPGLYWDLIVQGSCKALGEGCGRRVYDTIFQGYIPISDELVEEVWLTASDFDKWHLILGGLENIQERSGSESRQAFVSALVNMLQTVVKKPPIEATGETFAQYAQRRGGLPVRERSPLLDYEPDALLSRIPDCEIRRLSQWGKRVGEILSIVHEGHRKPDYKSLPYPEAQCPDASESGKRIPYIDGDIGSSRLGDTEEFSYLHNNSLGTRIYWVPQEFLP